MTEAIRAALLKLIDSVEWSAQDEMADGYYECVCPVCGGSRRSGHVDCALQELRLALKED